LVEIFNSLHLNKFFSLIKIQSSNDATQHIGYLQVLLLTALTDAQW